MFGLQRLNVFFDFLGIRIGRLFQSIQRFSVHAAYNAVNILPQFAGIHRIHLVQLMVNQVFTNPDALVRGTLAELLAEILLRGAVHGSNLGDAAAIQDIYLGNFIIGSFKVDFRGLVMQAELCQQGFLAQILRHTIGKKTARYFNKELWQTQCLHFVLELIHNCKAVHEFAHLLRQIRKAVVVAVLHSGRESVLLLFGFVQHILCGLADVIALLLQGGANDRRVKVHKFRRIRVEYLIVPCTGRRSRGVGVVLPC